MESILDQNEPHINTCILKPSKYAWAVRTPKCNIPKVKSGFKRFDDWLLRFVPTPVKRPINNEFEAFKKKIMSLYPKQLKFEESKQSASKGFAEEHSTKPPTDQYLTLRRF